MYSHVVRGELYYADLDSSRGSEQSGVRPVVVIQNDVGNYYSPTTIIASLTTNIRHKHVLPTHLHICARDGLRHDSIVLLEQIRTIDKVRLNQRIGKLTEYEMSIVDEKLLISLGISAFSLQDEF